MLHLLPIDAEKSPEDGRVNASIAFADGYKYP
jgi:hypothetical protein